MDGKTRAFEKQGHLSTGDGSRAGPFGKAEEYTQGSTLEASVDEIEAKAVARDDSELRSVLLHEDDRITVIRLRAEAIGLGQESIRSPSEINPVLGQKYSLQFDGQHSSLLEKAKAERPTPDAQFELRRMRWAA
jgi:hypothetical protein